MNASTRRPGCAESGAHSSSGSPWGILNSSSSFMAAAGAAGGGHGNALHVEMPARQRPAPASCAACAIRRGAPEPVWSQLQTFRLLLMLWVGLHCWCRRCKATNCAALRCGPPRCLVWTWSCRRAARARPAHSTARASRMPLPASYQGRASAFLTRVMQGCQPAPGTLCRTGTTGPAPTAAGCCPAPWAGGWAQAGRRFSGLAAPLFCIPDTQ